MERVEDDRLLRGRGTFVDDLAPPGLLHAAVVRSPMPHGLLRAVDTDGARSLPGTIAVLTAADLDGAPPTIPQRIARLDGAERFVQPVVAGDRVRYIGEPVAVCVAASRAEAEDAAEAVLADIDPLDAVASVEAAAADGAPLLFPDAGTNRAAGYRVGRGDVAAAFAAAAYTRRETFRVQRHTAVPMETRGVVAVPDPAAGRLVVHGAAKVPFYNRDVLAGMLGLDRGAVDLIETDVGGGFGVRGEFYPEDFLIPFAAWRLGRPVKWIEDRHEHLMATNHSREVACTLEIACAADGAVLGLRGTVEADMGAYVGTTGGIVPSRTGQFLPGPYRIGAFEIEVRALVTNKTPVGSYRGPGRFEANFFRERLFDMAARDLGVGPAEMRRRNLLTEAELPWSIGRVVPYEGEAVYDSGDYPAVLARCLEEIRWTERQAVQGRLIDGVRHGLAVGCFLDSSGAGPGEHARITLRADGTAVVHVGSSALGQGIETTLTQIAADALELPPTAIEVRHGSTTLLAQGYGSYHSRSAIMGGNAVADAAARLLDAVRDAAAARFVCPPEAVRLSAGEAHGPGGAVLSLATIAGAAGGLSAEGRFGTDRKPYGYGSHAAYVTVDPETGRVRVVDYVAVEDVGRIVNPLIVHGQKLGAIVQGLGGALLEELHYDADGQLLTGTLADYLLPTATDFPVVRPVTLALRPTPHNPLGVKGAGEDGIAVVGGVVANAVAAALAPIGVEPTRLPLSPPAVWSLIAEARRRAAAPQAEAPAS